MNERFDLAPWELAPNSPEKLEGVAQARIRADWLGDEREFLLREVETAPETFVVFAREAGASERHNWTLYNSTGWAGVSSWCVRAPNVMNLFSRTERSGLGRLFHWSFEDYGTPAQGFVFVNAQGEAHLRLFTPLNDDPSREADLFFVLPMNDLANADSSVWRERIKRELSDKTSRARFALEWRLLSFEDKAQHAMKFERGCYQEMKKMFEFVLRCDVELSTCQKPLHWEYNWAHSPDEQWLGIVDEDQFSHRKLVPSSFLTTWRTALLKWFNASFDEEVAEQHLCVLQWGADNHDIFSVSISPPTHHERLEARLQLREWASGKMSDAQLESLLRGG